MFLLTMIVLFRISRDTGFLLANIGKTNSAKTLLLYILNNPTDENIRLISLKLLLRDEFRKELRTMLWSGQVHDIFKGNSVKFKKEINEIRDSFRESFLGSLAVGMAKFQQENAENRPKAFASIMKNDVSQILFVFSNYPRHGAEDSLLEDIVKIILPTLKTLPRTESAKCLEVGRQALFFPDQFYKDSRSSKSGDKNLAWYEKGEFGPDKHFAISVDVRREEIPRFRKDYFEVLLNLEKVLLLKTNEQPADLEGVRN